MKIAPVSLSNIPAKHNLKIQNISFRGINDVHHVYQKDHAYSWGGSGSHGGPRVFEVTRCNSNNKVLEEAKYYEGNAPYISNWTENRYYPNGKIKQKIEHDIIFYADKSTNNLTLTELQREYGLIPNMFRIDYFLDQIRFIPHNYKLTEYDNNENVVKTLVRKGNDVFETFFVFGQKVKEVLKPGFINDDKYDCVELLYNPKQKNKTLYNIIGKNGNSYKEYPIKSALTDIIKNGNKIKL